VKIGEDKAMGELLQNGRSLRSCFRGTLLGGAVGDALGMPTEEGPSRRCGQSIEQALGVPRVTSYFDSPNPAFLRAGQYTDDTQQTICLAETLLEHRGQFDPITFVDKLARAVQKEMRGVGPSTARLLRALRAGDREAVLRGECASAHPTNGGAMRVAPVALVHHRDLSSLKRVAVQSVQISHGHPTSIAGACAQAFAIAWCLKSQRAGIDPAAFRDEVASFVEEIDPDFARLVRIPETPVGTECLVVDTVFPVLDRFLFDPSDLTGGVLAMVNGDGDTDTKASMIGNLLGARNGIESVPATLLDGLENGPEGKDYLLALADRLADLSVALGRTGA